MVSTLNLHLFTLLVSILCLEDGKMCNYFSHDHLRNRHEGRDILIIIIIVINAVFKLKKPISNFNIKNAGINR